MPLAAGTRLGVYEILAPIGAGGMGEVYRARDTRLGREVALKVLPEVFAPDADRMARFEREAQVLASLNHPNIAALYGFEESDGVRALVMELVEGPTLAERLRAGPIPLQEALPLAKQMAAALEYAHEKGVVHRDLKPANVKITPERTVKVLDFGLAKALDDTPAASSVNNSPTMSLAATRAGVILGTAAYMSPEQACGKPVDKRSDIWSFGVVLWEMLCGSKLFDGETVSHTLAAVLTKALDWKGLPASAPQPIRALLRRCLERDPTKRLRDIGEARIAIEEAPGGAALEEAVSPRPALAASPRLLWLVATLAILAAVGLSVSVAHFRETPPTAPTTRFQVLPPEKATFVEYPAISPDGRRLAFAATVEGKTLLWVRPLDSLAAQPLAGTEDARDPFWSPDSRFLAFLSQGKLKKVDVSGGPPQTLCNADTPGRGGTWNRDGTILFGAGLRSPLHRVSAAGGVPAPVTTLDSATEASHRWPQFLPDGRHFLYWLLATDREKSAAVLASLDDKPDSKVRQRLLASGSMAVYSAGHLLFEREGTLMAQPFDAGRRQVRGEPFPVAQQVGLTASVGWAAFSVSPDGTLAYRTGSGAKTQLTWFDRAGKELGRVGQPEDQYVPRLSPDQKRVAVARRDAQGQPDLWLLELDRNTPTRFTFHPSPDSYPVWSPDGSRIVFCSSRDGLFNLYQKLSSGSAADELLLKSSEAKFATDWSSDGRFILYQATGTKGGYDLWVLPLGGDRKPFPVLQTEFNETLGQFSPDGRWIAYRSDESAPPQVFVQGFPKPGGKFQVSTNGGGWPRWPHDGKEIFYLTLDRKMMAVEVKATATTFERAQPRELFQTRAASPAFVAPVYDVTADGQRFLINTALESEGPPPMTVVMNWASGLKP